ncbi:MAG: Fe-S cluster protein [Armatimonadetes bacterium]|nr:Fe-S cluster protein [Armatimonadota bacterium]
MLVRKYSLRLYRPKCNVDTEKLNAFGLVSVDLSPVIPYLNAVIRGGVYSSLVPSLTFYHEGHMMTVQARQIGAAACADEAEARRLLDWLVELINDTWHRRDQIQPRYEEVPPLKPLEVYKLLPATNCRQCGEPTCLSFATKLVAGQRTAADCTPLWAEDRYREKAQALTEELMRRGYEVPAA